MPFAFCLSFCSSSLAAPGLLPEAQTARAGLDLPRYTLSLDLHLGPARFDARMHYRGPAAPGTTTLYFELLPNTPRFRRNSAPPLAVHSVTGAVSAWKETDGLLEVSLARPVAADAAVELQFEFGGTLPVQRPGRTELLVQSLEQLVGLLAGGQASDYGLFSAGDGILSLARFYPARLETAPAPGADLGDARTLALADYVLDLTAPEDFVLAGSGVVVATETAGPGRKRQRLEAHASRDLALALSARYQVRVAAVGPVLVRSFFDRDHEERGRLALESAAQALRLYVEQFGPYPYAELDVAEAPLHGGAAGMEFPGFVTIANLFYRPAPLTASEGAFARMLEDMAPLLLETLEFVVAHEVAHQWWNAAVASDALREPWLDESLANWSALLYFERLYGEEAAERQAFLQMRLNWLVHRMAGGADAAVNLPASAYTGSLQYAAVVYGKGALYFRELRRLLGDAAYFAALQGYYREHWLGQAESGDLLEAFARRAPQPEAVRALHRRWIVERHGDELLGRVSWLDLTGAMLRLRVQAARGQRPPRDPVLLLQRLFEEAAR